MEENRNDGLFENNNESETEIYDSNNINTPKSCEEAENILCQEEENNGSEENGAQAQAACTATDSREDTWQCDEANEVASASYVWTSGSNNSYRVTERSVARAEPEAPTKKKNANVFLLWLVPLVALISLVMGVTGGILVDDLFENDATPDFVDTTKITMNKNDAPVDVEVVIGDVSNKALTVSQVAELVADAVVEVSTSSVTTDSFFGNYVVSGAGSGVVIAQTEEYAYVVTNYHVIDGTSEINIITSDGDKFKAEFLDGDSAMDIAMLRIETNKEFPKIICGSSSAMKVGEGVVAIGNPLGELGGTVTDGIVSALDRRVEVDGIEMVLMQTNAAVNPGNSGGGLFNMAGELIGIVNAKEAATGVEGLGFAIPIDRVYDVLVEIIENKYIHGRPTLGIEVNYVSDLWEAIRKYGVNTTGVFVTRSSSDMIQVGDLINSINGELITDETSYAAAINDLEVGETIIVELYRVSEDRRWYKQTVEVLVEEYVPTGIFG